MRAKPQMTVAHDSKSWVLSRFWQTFDSHENTQNIWLCICLCCRHSDVPKTRGVIDFCAGFRLSHSLFGYTHYFNHGGFLWQAQDNCATVFRWGSSSQPNCQWGVYYFLSCVERMLINHMVITFQLSKTCVAISWYSTCHYLADSP